MKNYHLYKVLLPLCLFLPVLAFAYSPGFYTSSSVLSQGKWVKVEADTTGIFQIDYYQLLEWGFSDPTKVCVYGYGAIKGTSHEFSTGYKDDLPQTPCIHTNDGRLLFYAEGDVRATANNDNTAIIERNYYDTKAYYFLSDSKDCTDIPVIEYLDRSDVLDWNYCINLIEREVQNPGTGGAFFHDKKLSAGDSESFDFHIENFASDRGVNGQFRYEAAVKTSSATKITISAQNVKLVTNTPSNSGLTSSSVRLYVAANGSATFNSTEALPLDNTDVKFTLTIPTSFTGTYAAIDKTYIVYPRLNLLGDAPELMMSYKSSSSGKNFILTGADSDTEVWNVSDPTRISRYQLKYDAGSKSAVGSLASSTSTMRLVAFQPSKQQRQVKYIGEVANQNLHGEHTPDMLIVTNNANYEAAKELADIHRQYQGLDVLVVNQTEAFNEFTSGSKHPGAVRRLVKMFYDRDGGKLRYLALYGPATWDPRSITADRSDYLICYQVDAVDKARESATNYCSDIYFGILNDNYLHSSIAYSQSQISIGRIPAVNASKGKEFNKKIEAYLQNPPTARDYLRALMVSDDGDDNSHMAQSVDAIKKLKEGSPSLTAHRVDISIYPLINSKCIEGKALIERVLNSGVGYFSYSGHGSEFKVSLDDIYDTSLINKYTYNTWPLAMLATCDAFPLDRLSNTVCETLLFKQGGGAIGAIGACRAVYLEHNKGINSAVARAYGSASEGTTIGDIFRIGRNTLISGSIQPGLGDNTLCYNLCGDPAMPIGAPAYTIALETINGTEVGGSTPTINSLSKTKLSAIVTDKAGKTITDFNGSAIIDIYDTPFTRSNNTSKADTAYCDEILLLSVPAQVVNGRIEASIVVPEASIAGGPNRLVITATDDETHLYAGTRMSVVSISNTGDYYSSDIDLSAPIIEELYIDTPDFVSGDIVPSTFTLEAVIDPSETGLSTRIWNVAVASSLTLDGYKTYPQAIDAIRYDSEGKAHLKLTIENIAAGKHYFDLTVANNAGETTSETIDFTVIGTNIVGELALDSDSNLIRSNATIYITGPNENVSCHRLLISDSTGKTVLSKENCTFPFEWDLKDSSGHDVNDGKYRITALLGGDNLFGHTSPLEVVVVK
ncbi:MAG: type IX secretion system sortase PorU [Muribaculaceae bacterium]|nr:type IX secretion system sortase PorU [Muribaculaceae bacterium]